MARGESGRIVLEVDPEEKRGLYEALEKEGLTLKDWFLTQARRYLHARSQPELFSMVAESAPSYHAKEKGKND